ncbi:MAG: class II aldolase/adducin family protein [Deltaproteobacteria bacterium]|nr:class II aldolase/adducin family protein [Deltaproteobacteria bacterium]MBN2670640.1 class II aldolase/adducin family protein [Deltaproteobacteria bacterium]
MEQLIQKYVGKIVSQGLASPDRIVMGGLDDEFFWNRDDEHVPMLRGVFDHLNINSLLLCTPDEPYASILRYLAATSGAVISPKDSETRTFLHDLPIAQERNTESIVHHLKRRKGVLFPGGSVAAFGTVSPEETFVTFSSVCFAAYVKFMSDCLEAVRSGGISSAAQSVLRQALDALVLPPKHAPNVQLGPLDNETNLHAAICEAGRHTVAHRLVDSHFGNVSARWNNTVYVSQTGSSLDELERCIDPCPLDGCSSAGITASSELTAHMRIYDATNADVILHGHPRFCAILSLDCELEECANKGHCHIRCDKPRFVEDVPIVPGEVGTGPYGLCNTVPAAMVGNRGVIVYGHGLFNAASCDFQSALQNTFDIERMCMEAFIRRVP